MSVRIMATVLNGMPFKALLPGNIFQDPTVSPNEGVFITDQELQFLACTVAYNSVINRISVKGFIYNNVVNFQQTLFSYY